MSATRIARLFSRLAETKRKAFIAYLTAGDPSPEATPRLVAALERGGVDLIELGMPFSDPIADGPVVQRASMRSLAAGTTLPRLLEIAATICKRSEIPLLLFTYLNPVMRHGFESIAARARDAGIDGFLLTDLSVEEADTYVPVMRAHNLDTVFLAAPTSSERRLKLVAEYSTGFVYLVSRTGVTGERQSLSAAALPLVASMRALTKLPLAIGFGISTPEQAAGAGAVADAIVVGSAIVRLIETHAASADLEARLEAFARGIREALDGI